MIYDKKTIPLPDTEDTRLTFTQWRECYGFSRADIAYKANVHPMFLKRMEDGFRTELFIVVLLVDALSKKIGRPILLREIKGLTIKKQLTLTEQLAGRRS